METQMAQHRNVSNPPRTPAPHMASRRVFHAQLAAGTQCPLVILAPWWQAVAGKRQEVEKSLAMMKTLIANRVRTRLSFRIHPNSDAVHTGEGRGITANPLPAGQLLVRKCQHTNERGLEGVPVARGKHDMNLCRG